jgi:protein phosphatase
LVISAIVLLVLAGAAFGTYWAVLRQYYVGVADTSEIAVFQGVPGSILGVQLHRQVEGSCPPDTAGCEPITVDDLTQAGRVTVQNGITHLQSMQQARSVIQGLRTNQVLPECPKPSGPTVPPTTGSPSGAHLSTAHPAGPTSTNPLVGSDHGNGQLTVTTTPTATPPGPTTAPTSAPEPGVNCRKAGS